MSKDITWVIEECMFGDEYQAAMRAAVPSANLIVLKNGGGACQTLYRLAHSDGIWDKYCIFHGSIEVANDLKPSYEFGWNRWGHFRHSTLLAHWGDLMLNQEAVFLPLAELKRRHDALLSRLGRFWGIFVRVDDPFKGLRSFVYSPEKPFPKKLDPSANDEQMLLIAPARNLKAEWRFVVRRGSLIDGCQYAGLRGGRLFASGYSEGAAQKALQAANHPWQPEPIYMVDIAETESGLFFVMEAQPFSTTDFYLCDISKIVASATVEAELSLPKVERIDFPEQSNL